MKRRLKTPKPLWVLTVRTRTWRCAGDLCMVPVMETVACLRLYRRARLSAVGTLPPWLSSHGARPFAQPLVRGLGCAVQVALAHDVRRALAQEGRVFGRLHALGHHVQAQVLGHGEDGLDQRRVVSI